MLVTLLITTVNGYSTVGPIVQWIKGWIESTYSVIWVRSYHSGLRRVRMLELCAAAAMNHMASTTGRIKWRVEMMRSCGCCDSWAETMMAMLWSAVDICRRTSRLLRSIKQRFSAKDSTWRTLYELTSTASRMFIRQPWHLTRQWVLRFISLNNNDYDIDHDDNKHFKEY